MEGQDADRTPDAAATHETDADTARHPTMHDDTHETRDAPTRRTALRLGGAVVAGGLLAGCMGESGTDGNATDGTTGDAAGNATAAGDGGGDGSDGDADGGDTGSYSVTMAPMGEVTFDAVPERWATYSGDYADMAVALGHGDGITGIGNADRYYTYVYDELPGVSFDRTPIEEHPEVRNKEEFYALDSDVHLYDPRMLINWFDWKQQDVDEIRENVAPFLGNLIFRREDEWHDYRYYTLYQAFGKMAELFQERERYEAMKALHDDFIADVQARMPPAGDRPNVLLTFAGSDEPEAFSPYRLNDRGTSKKQWRDLGVADALAGTGVEGLSTTDRGKLDYETLLEVDPDVLLVRGQERKSAQEFRDTVLAFMRDHPVASEMTAVEEGRVYRGGYLYQGPIHNLFLTERAAKQLYPDEFGAVTGDAELFDRDRVAAIVRGEV